MKKLSIVIAGLMFSGAASAIQFGSSGLLIQQNCTNLNEDVSINLTTGVVAGVDCDASRVAIAACHTSGMLKSRSITRKTVPGVGVDANGDPNPATIVTGCVVGAADPGCAVFTVSGASIPGSTTLAGTVNIAFPGTGACTVVGAETQAGTL